MRLNFLSWLSGVSYLFIKAAVALLLHVVPCPCVLVLILTVTCAFNALLPEDSVSRAAKNLNHGYLKHIWVVAIMEASQVNSGAVNTCPSALVTENTASKSATYDNISKNNISLVLLVSHKNLLSDL